MSSTIPETDLVAQLHHQLQQQSEQLAATRQELESLAYIVSHDLKAPLRGVMGYSSILLEEKREQLDEEGRELIDQIHDAASQMNRLLEGLLRYARIDRMPCRIENLPLLECAREALETVQERYSRCRFSLDIPNDATASGDRAMVVLALEHLLDNAAKFSSKQESPHVLVREIERTPETRTLIVKDNGTGFSMKYLNKLFVLFSRLHRAEEFPGAGTGLAIVRKLAERNRGRVWAEGELGAGATFSLELAAASPESLNP